MPEISIIVPVYNAEKTLKRCLESILKQSFADFELVLVDDGSSDCSLSICNEYAYIDSRIKVIHQENCGSSAAHNTGITMATGNYIMFCDSDDYCDSRWCEIMFMTIRERSHFWVVSNAFKIDSKGQRSISTDLSQIEMNHCGYEYIFKNGLSPYCWNKIYEKSILSENNIRFNSDCSLGEDVLFNIAYYRHCDGVIYIPDPVYFYCDNANSLMHRYRHDLFEENCYLFRERLTLIKQEELEDFCDQYFYYFIKWLDYTWDERNTDGFLKKMRYNDKRIKSDEFRFCAKNVSDKVDSALFMRIIRRHNYYIYWLFIGLTKIKSVICKRLE